MVMDTTVLITDYDGKCCTLFAYCHSCICFLLVLMNINRQKIRQNPQKEGRGRKGKGASSHFFLACEQSSLGQEKEGECAITSLKLEFHLQFPCEHPTTRSQANFFSSHSPYLSHTLANTFCVSHGGRLTKNG